MRAKKDSVTTGPTTDSTTDETTKNDEDIGNASDEDINQLQKEVRLCGKWSKELKRIMINSISYVAPKISKIM
jgi:hypothetical protein